ncbi:uncharacterized protein C11orf97 homolog isoform X2 [Sceloporus undulatus]|uniref:uncharacterized protein C11orf97 homolog isoform X2 n=1 Tax=Sceloporus undulatus TaxID=8520 RepID=UPI001C4D7EB7|nr:uncharacterized protein C11orf97 homolog isoform X2 [Sceloporus undulatus]
MASSHSSLLLGGRGGIMMRTRAEPGGEPTAAATATASAAGECGGQLYAEHKEGGQPWKKFVYAEPPRRVKEVLEEELYFRRDECRIKHPSEG